MTLGGAADVRVSGAATGVVDSMGVGASGHHGLGGY